MAKRKADTTPSAPIRQGEPEPPTQSSEERGPTQAELDLVADFLRLGRKADAAEKVIEKAREQYRFLGVGALT